MIPERVINIIPNQIMFNGEIAKQLKGFKGYYATKSGKIISIKKKGGQGTLDVNNPREHSIKIDKDGYKEVCLSIIDDNGKHIRKYRRVHRLIWETFNGEIKNELTIDHIDKNPQNNELSNLRLLPREINTSIAKKGTVPWQKGKKHVCRVKFNVFIHDEYFGTFDRQELKELFRLKKNDFDGKRMLKDTARKVKLGITLELFVEDIEKVGNNKS